MEKFFDLIPPKKFILKKEKIPPKISHPKFKLVYFLGAILIFFFFLFVIILYFREVKIIIFPKIEKNSLEMEVLATTSVKEIDVEAKKIPASFFQFEETFSEIFPTTGKVLTKAEGKIRLFNAFATFPEVWRQGTRFISAEGKIFKSKTQILVPPAILEKDRIKPSFVDIPVEAAEGGASYNIGPSKFAVLVFRGTERYSKYWGESYEPMKGGGEKNVLTDRDLKEAESKVLDNINRKVENFLVKKIPENFVILENSYLTEIIEKGSKGNIGDIVDNFEYWVKVKISLYTFKRSDIESFIKKFLLKSIPPEKKLKENSIYISFPLQRGEIKNGNLEVRIKSEFQTIPIINLERIKEEISQKSISESERILLERYPIEKVFIKKFPFFLKKIPEKRNVQIEIVID